MRRTRLLLGALVLGMAVCFFMASSATAQYWQAMPPYNVLWPLWTQTLSPVDPLTGKATPLVSSLTSSTVLPVTPSFIWDIEDSHPWFLYNAPAILGGSLYYFDPLTGFNTFPPPDHILPGGVIVPNTLPLGYELLIPPFQNVDLLTLIANNAYTAAFGSYVGAIPYLSLVTPEVLWGVPPFPVF